MVGATSSQGRIGNVIAGRYRLETRIGTGGMGEVYRALHLELGVPVAVKLLSPAIAGSERAVQRFRREARAAARLKSRHIVHVYDFGTDGELPYLVMELLEGETLSERLAHSSKLPPHAAATLLEQASRGLAVAHAQGVIHRDIKPSNLFLTRSEDGELLKLLDFGIARAQDVDVTVTASQEVVGSPLYMSPEQVNGESLDPRSDVWSLATVVYRMLTGVDAFRGPNTSSVLLKITGGAPERATLFTPELPPALDAFFERAFARDPSARFQSAQELADAFAHAMDPTCEAQFFRTETTTSLSSPNVTRTRRSKTRWLLPGVLAVAVSAAIVYRNRGSVETDAAPSGSTAVRSRDAVIPVPKSAAPAATTDVTVATVRPSASARPSLRAPRAREPVREKSTPKAPSPEPAPAAVSANGKVRDPLFGL